MHCSSSRFLHSKIPSENLSFFLFAQSLLLEISTLSFLFGGCCFLFHLGRSTIMKMDTDKRACWLGPGMQEVLKNSGNFFLLLCGHRDLSFNSLTCCFIRSDVVGVGLTWGPCLIHNVGQGLSLSRYAV